MNQDEKVIKETRLTPIFKKWGTINLRLLFLGPLALIIGIVVFILSQILYEYTNREVQNDVIHTRALVQDFYRESILYDAKALQAVVNTLRQDDKLVKAFIQADRAKLLYRATPIFKDIKRDFSISHLYFTDVDKVNILRVHTPSRYGDIIKRITMDNSVKSGVISYGVELGPLGTFTLRVVSPWYDDTTHKLIGYVEIGMEITHIILKLQQFFNIQTFTLINKEFLKQDKWEVGMSALGRTPNWNRFENVVTTGDSINKIPHYLSKMIMENKFATNDTFLNYTHKNFSYRISSLPLKDASRRAIAKMILITDVSNEEKAAQDTVNIGVLTALIGGFILFTFFYFLVGRIEDNENALHKLAMHDGLTGLYNHKFFYHLLTNELIRSQRYKCNTSLLLLDIDHFKKVNDTYGHVSGDMVLKEISNRLLDRVRATDAVCRYGGEEIVIILPDTTIDRARNLAEELRTIIEKKSFEVENEQHISITTSIGISVSPENSQEPAILVSYADKALYQAKNNGRNRVCTYGDD